MEAFFIFYKDNNMHVKYPRDLFKPLKRLNSFENEALIILPYKINETDKYRSDILCLAYQKGDWYDPLFDNPKFGLDYEWETNEWEMINDIPNKESLIFILFSQLHD